MADKEPKKMEPADSNLYPPPDEHVTANYASEEKSVFPVSDKATAAFVEKISNAVDEKMAGDSIDRESDIDTVLARIELEKRLALIKAWEDSEKTQAENKAYKKISAVNSWENSKRAAVEAQLRMIEEKLEKKKAKYEEEMKNKMGEIHKAGEEKRASIQAVRSEQFLKVEETAAKYRAAGFSAKKLLGCFSG